MSNSIHDNPELRSLVDANTLLKYRSMCEVADFATSVYNTRRRRKLVRPTTAIHVYQSGLQYCPDTSAVQLPTEKTSWVTTQVWPVFSPHSVTTRYIAQQFTREALTPDTTQTLHDLIQFGARSSKALVIETGVSERDFLSRHTLGDNEILRDVPPLHPLRKKYGLSLTARLALSYVMRVRYDLPKCQLVLTFSDVYLHGSDCVERLHIGERRLRLWTRTEIVSALQFAGYQNLVFISRDTEGLLWVPHNVVDYPPETLVAVLAYK